MKKKIRGIIITAILFIVLLIILEKGIYIPKEVFWMGIGYILCPISVYTYYEIKKYIKQLKKDNFTKN